MYRAGFYRGGPIMMSAIAGIDQALWDIKGKVLNAPVWQLMGAWCATKSRPIAGWVAIVRQTSLTVLKNCAVLV
ncbi:galactonate dehydratase [Salmonella enterica subsp. enterica]|uniref:Galactonate dehydratase n=1 Tax=Salmonella enterica I TaxID=59201 RepID=A0A379VZZ2_SALET|nr:galactonate dehydratase [Salmonella enterica subsp. enterica]